LAEFVWDDDKRIAAAKLAVGDLTNDQIAEELDIGIATLYLWKRHEDFKAEVLKIKEQIREEIIGFQIANPVHRIMRANKRWQKIDKLFDARSKEMDGEIAGGDTGLLVRDYKGKDADRAVYSFDAALVREERELQKYVSQELGQWTEKVDIKDVTPKTPEELQALEKQLLEQAKQRAQAAGVDVSDWDKDA
jgi:hypothetical protein